MELGSDFPPALRFRFPREFRGPELLLQLPDGPPRGHAGAVGDGLQRDGARLAGVGQQAQRIGCVWAVVRLCLRAFAEDVAEIGPHPGELQQRLIQDELPVQRRLAQPLLRVQRLVFGGEVPQRQLRKHHAEAEDVGFRGKAARQHLRRHVKEAAARGHAGHGGVHLSGQADVADFRGAGAGKKIVEGGRTLTGEVKGISHGGRKTETHKRTSCCHT